MNPWSSRFTLPLLTRALIAQANGRRLYLWRASYVGLLALAAATIVAPMFSYTQLNPLGHLGSGQYVFQTLMLLQFAGIYLFLPALSCGALTIEKERNTLGLLFLTRLGPWAIIFEKLGVRLLAMFGLLMTSLPLIAISSALGGLQIVDLIYGVWFLGLSVLQVACVALLTSAFFRSTAAALLATYFIVVVSGFAVVIADQFFLNQQILNAGMQLGQGELSWLFVRGVGQRLGFILRLILAPAGMYMSSQVNGGLGDFRYPYATLFALSVPALLMSAICLGFTRWFLVRRAFMAPSNSLLGFFKSLDRVFTWINRRYARGIILVSNSQSLPEMQPIAWRETTKRSLGQFRYLTRVLIALEIPVVLLCLYIFKDPADYGTHLQTIASALFLFWMIAALIITTNASGLISGERGRQTLDVLLTSPLSSRQIILEKLSGVLRLFVVCAVPLLTLVLFQTRLRFERQSLDVARFSRVPIWNNSDPDFIWHEYLIGGILTVAIYLPFIAWLSVWMGIRIQSGTRAILLSQGILTAWCVVPIMLSINLFQYLNVAADPTLHSPLRMLLLTSPAGLIVMTEFRGAAYLSEVPYLAVILNSLIYGTCLLLLRWSVLSQADRYLGRLRNSNVDEPPRRLVKSSLMSKLGERTPRPLPEGTTR